MKTAIPQFVIAVLILCLGSAQNAQAVSPPPDGWYGPPAYGAGNTAEGQDALFSLTTGIYNTGVGWKSLWRNTDGIQNTAIGAGTLRLNTANQNTATGAAALYNNTSGMQNTANGAGALAKNTTGYDNTAAGYWALFSNIGGFYNTATGEQALFSNTYGSFNTATGIVALYRNTTGSRNTAIGTSALYTNTFGRDNTAISEEALFSNINGNNNTAIGNAALFSNTSGDANIALGTGAGFNLTTGDNNIDIGNAGGVEESNTIRIGSSETHTRTFIAGIRGKTTGFPNAVNVLIDSAGQLGTISSSRRFKHDIQPMAQASESLLSLKPVRFHYNGDKTNTPQFGLIAEEVAEVNPDLVVRDENGEIYSVRYDAVNAMLLNEFLKTHQRIEEQDKRIDQLTVQLKQQVAEIQKVSAQLELSKAAPQTVLNSH